MNEALRDAIDKAYADLYGVAGKGENFNGMVAIHADGVRAVLDTIRAAATATAAQPVAWKCEWTEPEVGGFDWFDYRDENDPLPKTWDDPPTKITPLYAEPPPGAATPNEVIADLREASERAGLLSGLLADLVQRYRYDGIPNDTLPYVERAEAALTDSSPGAATPIAPEDAKDAARYRWLRTFDVDSYLAAGRMEALDAAIDAALAPPTPEGKPE